MSSSSSSSSSSGTSGPRGGAARILYPVIAAAAAGGGTARNIHLYLITTTFSTISIVVHLAAGTFPNMRTVVAGTSST